MTSITLGPGGEFDRVRQIAVALGAAAGPLGDDTAPIPTGDGTLVVSTDTSVDGVHFRRDWLLPDEIGWRSAAAALSDLAAAAAVPAGLVVALTVPSGTADSEVIDIMRGVGDVARTARCQVLGGDLTAGPALSLTVTVLGHAPRPMSRVGAVPGDGVWVTGLLGGAHAALLAWRDSRTPATASRLVFARPRPRLEASQWLATQGATAMLDLSDGLGGDVPHLAAASHVGISIDLAAIPIHPSVHAEAERGSGIPAVLAASGGEDYELLVTLPAEWGASRECEAATGSILTRIGSVEAGSGVHFRLGGTEHQVTGYRHAL